MSPVFQRIDTSSLLARGIAVALWLAVSAPVWADGPSIEPNDTPLRCLVAPPKDKLRYDRDAIRQKIGGVVQVRLTFDSAERGPEIEVTSSSGSDEFVDAVRDRVKSYRLPCFRSGDVPLVATQEFRFDPGDGRKVFWNGITAEQDDSQRKTMRCLIHAEQKPEFPFGASDQGAVFANLIFTDPDLPPAVQIVYDGGSKAFARTASEYLSSYRLPCMTRGEAPIYGFQEFRFMVDGGRSAMLKDSRLITFVGAIEKPELQHVRFDFTTMSCPFEVRFVLRQPYLPNEVGEVERPDPNRGDFLKWLRGVKLRLPERTLSRVIGDSMTIAVPCVVLDLT